MSQISRKAGLDREALSWLDARRLDRVAAPRLVAWAAAALAIGTAPAFVARFLTDMDFYAHVADKLLNGGVLYRDAMDTKPPAIFFHYAAVFGAFGENNLVAIKLVTVGFVALTAVGIAAIWRELYGNPNAPSRASGDAMSVGRDAALASLLFALGSVCGWGPDFLSSNTEILANLFIVCGVLCLCRGRFGARPGSLTAAGALVGIAFLYRFQSGAALAAYVTFLGVRRRTSRAIVAHLWPVAIGFVLPIAGVVAAYDAIDALPALAGLLRYDYFYLRGSAVYWPALLAQTAVVLVSQALLLALAGPQAFRTVRGTIGDDATSHEGDLFVVLWLGWTTAAFLAGGRFFAHYFVQAIPPIALLAARRLTTAQHPSAGRSTRLARTGVWYRRHAPALLSVQAAIFAAVNGAFFWWTREPPNPYPDLVRFVQARTSKRDRIYVWTPRTHVLFAMDRVYATRFISNDFLVGRMYGTRHRRRDATAESARAASVSELWPLLMHDLESDPPTIVIDDMKDGSNFTLDHYPELRGFVARRYEPCRQIDGFCVYVRRTDVPALGTLRSR